MVQDGVDAAVRVGQLGDSSLKALRVGSIRHVICASPEYLARRGTPATPSDLGAHDCVTFTGLEGAKEWTFRSARNVDRLTIRSRLAVNTAEAAADAATAGVGITRLLCYQVSNAVLDGRLKLLLRKFEPAPLPVSLVSPDAKLVPQKLRAFVDFRRSTPEGAPDFQSLILALAHGATDCGSPARLWRRVRGWLIPETCD